MPKETRASSARQTQPTALLDPLVVAYGTRKVAIRRIADYQDTLATIKRSVRALAQVPASDILLKCNTIPHQGGEYVDISEDAWPDLVSRSYLKTVIAELEHPPSVPSQSYPSTARVTQSRSPQPHVSRPSFQIEVISDWGPPYTCHVKPTTKISSIHYVVAEKWGKYGQEECVGDYDMSEGDVIDAVIRQAGGKPVIYLFPPASGPSLDATVDLALSAPWSLSAIYPMRSGTARINDSYGQTTSWTVRADSNGVLHDKETSAEVSYLYWEALTNPPRPLSPPASPRSTPTTMELDPSRARLSPNDSVVLPVDKVPAYLDGALFALTLHTEARTSFITYWLPSILKHAHVALRFVPQVEYEQAARLTVTPAPDVTTRIFMLFCGVAEGEMLAWKPAVERVGEDVAFWKDVVGIDASAAQDASLFRVLEWGGMEVVTQ